MSEPQFRSDILVKLNFHAGSDLTICQSAWNSSGKEEVNPTEKRMRGLLNALIRDKHGSPFESGFLEFYIEAPRAVRDEAVRHRNLSFSSSSLRYTLSDPVFYVPPPERPLKKAEDFKQIQPKYEILSESEYESYVNSLKSGHILAHTSIQNLVLQGFEETEQIRWLTNDAQYVTFRVRGMPRQILQFIALRTHNEAANHVSFPMWEIKCMADQMESAFKEVFPLTYEAWNTHGREI